MDLKQKRITTLLWAACVLAMVTVVTGILARRTAPHPDIHKAGMLELRPATPVDPNAPRPVLFPAPAFALTNQDGRPVASDQFKGHPYVAAFVFTNCAGTCPMMSTHMAKLQQAIPDADVKLVSFTVDPVRDTPERLKAYAARFEADERRWSFLTGTKSQLDAVTKGFNVSVVDPTAGDQVIHSERFFLVDADGNVRGTFSGTREEEMKELAEAVGKLGA